MNNSSSQLTAHEKKKNKELGFEMNWIFFFNAEINSCFHNLFINTV